MTCVHEFDPLHDARWAGFLNRHPQAGVFHTAAWLSALQQTYGYRVSGFTTSAPGQPLTAAVVFCRVKSWLTGRRLVALPFSDHCAPLVESEQSLGVLLSRLREEGRDGREKYVELRPSCGAGFLAAGLGESASYCLHRLDLRPGLNDLFQALHNSCIRRKITKAEHVGLLYEEGRSEELLQKFYRLSTVTRRRQGIPPQPLAWFRNLIAALGEGLKIRIASHEGQPAAAILTLCFKHTMTYKYGCSDTRFHKLGAMQLLFWRAIQEAKGAGLLEFDMGRSDWSNSGLLTFKDRWGSARTTLTYYRFPVPVLRPDTEELRIARRIARRILSAAPDRVLNTAGRLLYRHIA